MFPNQTLSAMTLLSCRSCMCIGDSGILRGFPPIPGATLWLCAQLASQSSISPLFSPALLCSESTHTVAPVECDDHVLDKALHSYPRVPRPTPLWEPGHCRGENLARGTQSIHPDPGPHVPPYTQPCTRSSLSHPASLPPLSFIFFPFHLCSLTSPIFRIIQL